jgi:ribosome maturation factor RimP
MGKDEIVANISALGRKILEEAGMELVHVDLGRQRGGWLLRIFIDKPGGVSLDDCAAFSRQIDAELDTLSLMESSYTLEVSSPGLDRPLRNESDFLRCTGKQVAISTFEPIQGRRHIVGRLSSCASGIITVIDQQDNIYSIPAEKISKARLHVEF